MLSSGNKGKDFDSLIIVAAHKESCQLPKIQLGIAILTKINVFEKEM